QSALDQARDSAGATRCDARVTAWFGSASAVGDSNDPRARRHPPPITTPPHVRAITGHTHRCRGVRDRPTGFDALTQTKTPFGRERSVTVHWSLRCEWVVC